MTQRQEKVVELLRKLVSEFLAHESNRTSLITVTRVDIAPNFRRATIYVSVYPTEKAPPALNFLLRRRSDLRDYIKEKSRLKILPVLTIELDRGEENRQRVDDLLNE